MEYENFAQEAPVVQAAPEKKQPTQIIRYAIIGVVAIVVLALAISIFTALLPGKFETRDANNIDWAVNDDGEMVFVFNGKKMVEVSDDITEEMQGEYGYSISLDYNREYAVFKTVGEQKKNGEFKHGDLYVVNSKKCQKVAEEVSSFELSAFGDTIIYIADGDLFVVEMNKPTKSKKIDSDVSGISAVSPDGKTFAYYTIDEKEAKDEEEESSIKIDYFISKKNKKGEKFGKKDAEIFALSNGAKYVYYTKGDKVYANDSKLADEIDQYYLNRDGSQMIYSAVNSKEEYKTYIVNKAGEKVSIGDGSFSHVLAPNGVVRYDFYNVASFAKSAVVVSDEGDAVYYYLKNVKSAGTKISALKNATQVQLLDDGTTALFVKKGDLRSVNITKPTSEPKTYAGFEEDVYTFEATADGKHIYVVDTDRTLYYVKSIKKAVKIQEDLFMERTEYYSYLADFYVMEDGSVYFINDDEEFCYAKKSAKTKVITDELGDHIDCDTLAGVLNIVCEDEYGYVKGAKFKKMFAVD